MITTITDDANSHLYDRREHFHFCFTAMHDLMLARGQQEGQRTAPMGMACTDSSRRFNYTRPTMTTDVHMLRQQQQQQQADATLATAAISATSATSTSSQQRGPRCWQYELWLRQRQRRCWLWQRRHWQRQRRRRLWLWQRRLWRRRRLWQRRLSFTREEGDTKTKSVPRGVRAIKRGPANTEDYIRLRLERPGRDGRLVDGRPERLARVYLSQGFVLCR